MEQLATPGSIRLTAATLRLVLRTANAAPVWRGGNGCFNVRYRIENGGQMAAELYEV